METEKIKRYDIICLPPQDKPVYFVLDNNGYYGTYDPETRAYTFEEGTCPTNHFIDHHSPTAILTDGDCDPHGLFEYVRTIEAEDNYAGGTDVEWWREVLPEAFT